MDGFNHAHTKLLRMSDYMNIKGGKVNDQNVKNAFGNYLKVASGESGGTNMMGGTAIGGNSGGLFGGGGNTSTNTGGGLFGGGGNTATNTGGGGLFGGGGNT